MTADSLEVLVSVPSEVEASAILSVLGEQGIEATATGGLTAGFRAEAPGEVQVLVETADVARARQVLADTRTEPQVQDEEMGTIVFQCESCDQPVQFPGSEKGSIQSCPECGEWLDVP